MPIYEVSSLDMNGNPVDGYEFNDQRSMGTVYIPPAPADDMTADAAPYDQVIVEALVYRRKLGVYALTLLEQGQVEVVHDEFITIAEVEPCFVDEEGNFLEMAPRPTPEVGRAVQRLVRAGHVAHLTEDGDARPILQLDAQFISDNLSDVESPLWETRLLIPASGGNMTPDEHELSVEANYDVESSRINVTVVVLNSGRPETADEFEWELSDWRRRPTLGFDPLTSEELIPTQEQLNDILVALDAFMEKHE